ncbi:MAG: heavy metal translocating P-type ATPase [Rhabdochlamydiaceae bacterium]
MNQIAPFVFDEFFASGKEESISPFLTPQSRGWGKNLTLKTALFSGFLLLSSFSASFFLPPLSHLLLLFVYFFAGTPALLGSIEDIKNLEINIDVLMTLAALLSVMIGSGMEGALLLVLFELSAAMENTVSEKTKGTLLSLHQLSPRFACVLSSDNTLYDKAVKEIPIGTHLLIKAGEIVPLDGIVVDGSSFVNLFHLTGESHPVSKKKGDEVQAGARNLDGTLTLIVTRTSSDSTLTRIIQLITEAQEAKPKLQRFLDRFGKWYAMTIISLFFIFALTLPLIFSIPYLGIEGGIYRALAFLIAASPCALIIATPTAYLSAISCCARKGILLKGGVVLDALANCKRIAFDKTGTLTTGKLSCVGIESISAKQPICSVDEALAIAYGLERNAVHPIADAIVAFAKEKSVKPKELLEFKAVHGYGLEGKITLDEKSALVFIGHGEFIAEKIPTSLKKNWESMQTTHQREGHLSTLLLVEETLFLFHFLDTLRSEAIPLIDRLKNREGLKPMMLTGDHWEIARAVAKQVGIDDIFANLRPEDKLAKVAEVSNDAGLIMVGDGINDAPALARSTVGISLGKIGSATAIDASDIVFLNDDLSLLDWLVRKARHTLSIVKQNISLALCVIVFATVPALLGLIPLWIAVILHEGGTVLVGLNSLRLLKK